MATEQSTGPLTIADFSASDWEQVIDACSKKESFHFAAALGREASVAENSGDLRRTQLFRFIAEAASIGWESGASGEVFRPQATFTDGTRTRIPADYSDEEIGLLKALAPTIRDPEMRARISDIVWERARDYASAQVATDAYLESSARLEDPVNWSSGAKRLERALNLSLSIGDKARKKMIIAEIEIVLARYNGNDPLWLSSYLMDLLLNVGEGDPAIYSALAGRSAENARKAGDWRRTRGYLEIKAKWLRRAGKTADENGAKIESAETHVTEADSAEKATPPNYLVIVHHLELAISAFRGVGGQAARVTALRKRLLDVQPQTITQMKRIEVPTPDLTDRLQKAIQAVTGKSFHAALIELSLMAGSPKIDQLRQIAKDMASAAPLSSSIAHSFQTGLGKTAAKVPGMKVDADENDPAVRSIMFRAADMHRMCVAQVAEGARWQIIREHAVSLADWNDVVCDNPFVPPGREQFFAEGLHFGLNGNFVAAAHLLIPQIENSYREMLAARGVIVSTHDQDGIEREMYINELILTVPEFRTLFGEDLAFDFRGLLIEQQGSNLRHGMAHGLYNYPAFQSPPSIYLWWLVLSILCLLVRERLVPEAKPATS
jgi:hypothetical protein